MYIPTCFYTLSVATLRRYPRTNFFCAPSPSKIANKDGPFHRHRTLKRGLSPLSILPITSDRELQRFSRLSRREFSSPPPPSPPRARTTEKEKSSSFLLARRLFKQALRLSPLFSVRFSPLLSFLSIFCLSLSFATSLVGRAGYWPGISFDYQDHS